MIFSSYGQELHVLSQYGGEIILDVISLKNGSYFIVIDKNVFSFLEI
ncbi:MAG TPA: hypothetical protein VM935_20045 [Chitinophagaceae bacterium]|nr:hypothetical protein [Chitinophagaceae bacterium]